jgi:hypothetical protein
MQKFFKTKHDDESDKGVAKTGDSPIACGISITAIPIQPSIDQIPP